MILSVDLASRRYQDIGIALMRGDGSAHHVTLIEPRRDLGLHGAPDVQQLADALLRTADEHGVRVILIDGPQAWRANVSPLVHSRHCERETRCPGKTGLPGVVLPKGWTSMAMFSIALFDALHAAGWPRFTSSWSGERAAIESFPTHAWRSLGHPVLPGKGRKPDLAPWRALLRALLRDAGVEASLDHASHDELQAVVAGLGGLQLCASGVGACDVRGTDPRVEDGLWREGFIVSPAPSSGSGHCNTVPTPSPAPTSGAR